MSNNKVRIVAKDSRTATLYIDGKNLSRCCESVNLEIVAGMCHKLTVVFNSQEVDVELENVEVVTNADIE